MPLSSTPNSPMSAVRQIPPYGTPRLDITRGELGRAAVHRHRPQDPAGRVQAGVEAGERRRQHDDVHDGACASDADLGEEGDERALTRLVGGVREQQPEQEDRADIEERDARDDRVDRARHDLRRVRGLARRGADEFDCGIGEHDAGGDDDEREETRREQSAVVDDHTEAGRLVLDLVAARQEDRAGDQERHQCNDLDQRSPELQLAEHLHRDQVHAEHERQRDECDEPLRDRRERLPEVEVGGDRRRVDDRRHRPVEEIHPTRDERRLLAEELTRIRHERTRRRPVQHQLSERAQDQEHEDAAERVHQEQAGSGAVQPAACAEEQPGADGAADGDHLKLSRFEALVIALVFGGERGVVVLLLLAVLRSSGRTVCRFGRSDDRWRLRRVVDVPEGQRESEHP